jgi:hypothetical protein
LTASIILTGEEGANKRHGSSSRAITCSPQRFRASGRTEAARRIGRHVYRSAAVPVIEPRRAPPIVTRRRPSGPSPRHGEVDPRCPPLSVPIV